MGRIGDSPWQLIGTRAQVAAEDVPVAFALNALHYQNYGDIRPRSLSDGSKVKVITYLTHHGFAWVVRHPAQKVIKMLSAHPTSTVNLIPAMPCSHRKMLSWDTGAHPLWSHFDMLVDECYRFHQVSTGLSDLAEIFASTEPKDARLAPLQTLMSFQCMTSTLETLGTLGVTEGAFWRDAWDIMNDLELALDPEFALKVDLRADRMARDFKRIRKGFTEKLKRFTFVHIPAPQNQYFENDALMGAEVHARFPEIEVDAHDAGNCLAAQLHTAAVFHLMRVAEFGLRSLAKRLRVKLVHKKVPLPIGEADWQTIITAISNKLDQLPPLPKGVRSRRSKLQEWSDANDHCLFMKDIWRNNTAHNRKPCIEAEALAALGRVRDFMRFLAVHV